MGKTQAPTPIAEIKIGAVFPRPNGGRYTVSGLSGNRVSFVWRNAADEETRGMLPLGTFRSMVTASAPSQLQDNDTVAAVESDAQYDPDLKSLAHMGIAVLLYGIGAGVFWLRGAEWWWYWPLWFAWDYFRDF